MKVPGGVPPSPVHRRQRVLGTDRLQSPPLQECSCPVGLPCASSARGSPPASEEGGLEDQGEAFRSWSNKAGLPASLLGCPSWSEKNLGCETPALERAPALGPSPHPPSPLAPALTSLRWQLLFQPPFGATPHLLETTYLTGWRPGGMWSLGLAGRQQVLFTGRSRGWPPLTALQRTPPGPATKPGSG